MPSAYTGLGVQLMETGEKAGTWGTLTNTNWNIIEQISGGYVEQAITSTPTTLSVNDGTAGATLAHRIIKFTGSIGENTVVTIPLDVQTFYIITNGSSGGYTVQFKYVSGSGSSVTWGTTDKGTKIIYAAGDDATNPNIVDIGMATLTGTQTLTNKTLTSPAIGTSILDTNSNELVKLTATGSATNEFTVANAPNSSGPTLSSTGSSDSNIDINITPKGTGKIALDGIKWPNADGNADQILTTDGSGVLSFVDNSGGTSWQSVTTGSTLTAVAGNGYPINTTSNACTVTLPASASVGDTIEFVDYARTWGTNAVTINQNSLNFQGSSSVNPVYDTSLQSVTIVYVDATQGWIPTVDDVVTYETATIVRYLVIGGGGGGGDDNGGGGGAGGLRGGQDDANGKFTATASTTYTAVVGAGGAGGGPGSAGSDSTLAGSGLTTITANGGGYGGQSSSAGGSTGGSGGGSGQASTTGGAGNEGSFDPVEGYDGGTSNNSGSGGSGGGGAGGVGAGASGATGQSSVGHGGIALTSDITGATVYYAGGGGGGGNQASQSYFGLGGGTATADEKGGGGNGAPTSGAGVSGTANTGGGAGGGGQAGSGGTGGLGVVIVRMADGAYASSTGTVTVDTSTVADETILTFTGNGTFTTA